LQTVRESNCRQWPAKSYHLGPNILRNTSEKKRGWEIVNTPEGKGTNHNISSAFF